MRYKLFPINFQSSIIFYSKLMHLLDICIHIHIILVHGKRLAPGFKTLANMINLSVIVPKIWL